MTVFERAFAVVIGAEGGYSNNPADPGGPTKYGITLATLSRSRARACTAADVQALTLVEAEAIYKRDYWDKIRGDDLPPPIALVVFDCLVNGGHPALWLQGALRVKADGSIGDITVAAAKAAKVADVVSEVNAQRMVYLASLPTWGTFGLGWARRIAHLGIAAVGFDDAAATVTLQTINPAPVVASLDDVRAAVREIMSEKVAA